MSWSKHGHTHTRDHLHSTLNTHTHMLELRTHTFARWNQGNCAPCLGAGFAFPHAHERIAYTFSDCTLQRIHNTYAHILLCHAMYYFAEYMAIAHFNSSIFTAGKQNRKYICCRDTNMWKTTPREITLYEKQYNSNNVSMIIY